MEASEIENLTWETERLRRENAHLRTALSDLSASLSDETSEQFTQQMKTLQAVTLELSHEQAVDALCRRAVELGLQRLGFDRLSVFLATGVETDEEEEVFQGTYGTDASGMLCVEHHIQFASPKVEMAESFAEGVLSVKKEHILFDSFGHEIGTGWSLSVALRERNKLVGVMFADNLLRKLPLEPHQMEILGLFGAAIGTLISRLSTQVKLERLLASMQSVVSLADDLLNAPSVDALYRLAVELARERLGVERCSLYVLSPDEKVFLGTYGTDSQRQTTDERNHWFISDHHWSHEVGALSPKGWRLTETERTYWDGENRVLVGSGWIAATPLRSQTGALGVFYNDAAVSGAAVNEELQATLVLYATLLGNMISRKQAEEALVQSEERYRTLVENAPEGIAVYDAETDYIIDCNTNVERMFGWTREEILQFSPLQLAAPHTREGLDAQAEGVEYIAQALQGKRPVVEWTLVRKDGSEFPGEVVLSRLPDASRALIRFSVTDVSERNQLREHLFHSRKLESVGRLAGGIAHDFNNLLTAILGYAEMAESELPLNSPPRRYLETIRSAGERAAELTRQLLAFARKQVSAPQVIHPNLLLENFEPILQRLVGEGTTLVLRLGKEVGAIKIDPSQLEQVMMNLVVNARDAMPVGGSVVVETNRVFLASAEQGGEKEYALFSVSDEGVGMSEETQRRLFEPFFTTKEVGKGTGLGLAMCYGIVNQNGGHIGFESRLGQGTTFKITLPTVQETKI